MKEALVGSDCFSSLSFFILIVCFDIQVVHADLPPRSLVGCIVVMLSFHTIILYHTIVIQ